MEKIKQHLTGIIVIGIILIIALLLLMTVRSKTGDNDESPGNSVQAEYPSDINSLRIVKRYTDDLGDTYWIGVSGELKKSYIVHNQSIEGLSIEPITSNDIMAFNIDLDTEEPNAQYSIDDGNGTSVMQESTGDLQKDIEETQEEFIGETGEITGESQKTSEETQESNVGADDIEETQESLDAETIDKEIIAEGAIRFTRDADLNQSQDYVKSLLKDGYTIYRKLETPYYCDIILLREGKARRIVINTEKIVESDIDIDVVNNTDYISEYIR